MMQALDCCSKPWNASRLAGALDAAQMNYFISRDIHD